MSDFYVDRRKKHPRLRVFGNVLVKFYGEDFKLYGDGLCLEKKGNKVYCVSNDFLLRIGNNNSCEVNNLLKCELQIHENCGCSEIVDNIMMASLTLGYKYYIAINKVYDVMYADKKYIDDSYIESVSITESNTIKICKEEFLVSDGFVEEFNSDQCDKYSLINGLLLQFLVNIKRNTLDNRFNKSYM